MANGLEQVRRNATSILSRGILVRSTPSYFATKQGTKSQVRSFSCTELSMKALKRRMIPIVVPLVMLFSSFADAKQGLKRSIPDFNTTECEDFQRRLLNHTLLSSHDRAYSTKLGIAGLSLSWSGLPALPLGISAIILGRRQSTPAVRELLQSGVTKENLEEINRLCSILIKEAPIVDASLEGMNRTAIILGSFSTVIASFVLIMQIFFGLFTNWKPKSCGDYVELVPSNADSVINRNLSLTSGDGKNDDEKRREDKQDRHCKDDIIHGVCREVGGVRILHNDTLDTVEEMVCVSRQS